MCHNVLLSYFCLVDERIKMRFEKSVVYLIGGQFVDTLGYMCCDILISRLRSA